MSAYIPPEKMTEVQIREQLDAAYKHWDDLKKNGGADPAWPDGLLLNLVRNHIIYWYRFLRECTSQTVQLSMFDAGFKLWLEKGGDSYDAIDYSDGSVDCGQIDATCADEIVQYALFGELVFG